MTPLLPVIRRGTASAYGLRTPYSRPRGIRLRPILDADAVERLIARFGEAMQAGVHRTVVLGDWPPQPLTGPLSVDQAVDKVYDEYGDALRFLEST